MSRIGKMPVVIPPKVKVEVKGRRVFVEGPKGKLDFEMPRRANAKIEKDQIVVTRDGDDSEARAMHGLTRALVNNMVKGVTDGFTRELEINGVGYKAEIKGASITLSLGYSHPIEFKLPEGITAKTDKNMLILSGIDKQVLGGAASKIRSFRPPEPYKGKGIKYKEETILRKAGKTAGK